MQDHGVEDKRQVRRVRSFLRGEIVHSKGASRTECTVRDISEAGARIQVPKSVSLPEFFELIIPQKGRRDRVKMVWIKDGEIGVIFADETAASTGASQSRSELEHRISMLESELQKMRMDLMDITARLSHSNSDKGNSEVKE